MSKDKLPKGPILDINNKPIGEVGHCGGKPYLIVYEDGEFPDELTTDLIKIKNTSPQRPVEVRPKGQYTQ